MNANREHRVVFVAVCVLVPAIASPANAQIVFEDDFNLENGGGGSLNYTGFQQWSVSDGAVDLIGAGLANFYPGNGLYVDLDGTSGNAGRLTSTALFLMPGQYRFEFDLGYNPQGSFVDNGMTVSIGDAFNEAFATNGAGAPPSFAHISRDFVLATATDASIVFGHAGGDNLGARHRQRHADAGTCPVGSSAALRGHGAQSPTSMS